MSVHVPHAAPAARDLTLITSPPAHGEAAATDRDRLLARYRMILSAAHALSGATSTETLLPHVLKHLCRVGFKRAWLTTIDDDTLTIAHLLHAGTGRCASHEETWTIQEGGPEQKLIRRREAIAVAVPVSDTGPGNGAIATRSYVAAPVIFDTRVVAILCADQPARHGALTEEDREIVGAFARIAGEIIQRTLHIEQIDRLRTDMRELTGEINARADARVEAMLDLQQSTRPKCAAAPQKARLGDPSRIHEILTRRELEIMRLLAGGETNASIARLLVISDGTVKTHVRSILRKLHVTNRASAIGRYYKLTQAAD